MSCCTITVEPSGLVWVVILLSCNRFSFLGLVETFSMWVSPCFAFTWSNGEHTWGIRRYTFHKTISGWHEVRLHGWDYICWENNMRWNTSWVIPSKISSTTKCHCNCSGNKCDQSISETDCPGSMAFATSSAKAETSEDRDLDWRLLLNQAATLLTRPYWIHR